MVVTPLLTPPTCPRPSSADTPVYVQLCVMSPSSTCQALLPVVSVPRRLPGFVLGPLEILGCVPHCLNRLCSTGFESFNLCSWSSGVVQECSLPSGMLGLYANGRDLFLAFWCPGVCPLPSSILLLCSSPSLFSLWGLSLGFVPQYLRV